MSVAQLDDLLATRHLAGQCQLQSDRCSDLTVDND